MNHNDRNGYPYSIAFPISFTTYMCSIAGTDCFGNDKNGILFRAGTNTTLSTLEIYGIRMQLFSERPYTYTNDKNFDCEVYGRFIFLGY